MESALGDRLARNVKQLREARGLTQQQLSRLAGLPRATWANLESGAANPTLSVLHRVAQVLQISLEELVSAPRASAQLYRRGALPKRAQGSASVQRLLPDAVPGLEIDRIQLGPRDRWTGVPHTPGTREYLTCESGQLVLIAAGERWELGPGDVIAFRGDQKHSYLNPGSTAAVGFSVVSLAPRAATRQA